MSNIIFDEEIPEDLLLEYKSRVELGKSLAKNKKIVFCGLARNCAKQLENNISLLNRLGSYFKDYKIVVYENNSTDNTKKIIQKFNIDLIGEDDNESFEKGVSESRIKRMANYRNKCLDWIKDKYSSYDYVLLIDYDINTFSIDGILNSLSYEGDLNFDGIGSVSVYIRVCPHKGTAVNVHYDAWAFKMFSWFEEFSNKELSKNREWFSSWIPPIGGTPVKCISCFGGLMLYKMHSYISGKYDTHLSSVHKNIFCVEHSAFHESLYLNGYKNIYMNPSQKTIYV